LALVLASLDPLPVLLILAGFSISISNISANSLLQSTAPPHLRGRTVSLYMLAMRGGVSIGSLLTGLSVSVFGIREALLINGLAAFIAQMAIGKEWRRSSLPKPISEHPV
jgi:MFS family permease